MLEHADNDTTRQQANARSLAISLARIMAAALLQRQAIWSAEHTHENQRARAALRRFLAHGLLRLDDADCEDIRILNTTHP